MLARLTSAVLTGIDATLVDVETTLANGLPAFHVVGLPDVSVQEARERVRAAIHHANEPFPQTRITVNLAPSDVPKHGPGLDLAVALGLVVAQERAPAQGLRDRLFLGELGLSGDVRPVRGALAAAEAARREGLREVVCPEANAGEAALAGLPAVPVRTLREALDLVRGHASRPARTGDAAALLSDTSRAGLDLAVIRGQETAKRALEIAAAGGHNLIFTGPPGAGKTLLARSLPGILPPLSVDEALEITRIHSAAGLLRPGQALVTTRPFRAPHHGISSAGLIGGGSSWIRPGETSLASRGVLFLDELPEFPRSCLEALRQPMEDGVVTIVRARHAVTYPARFQLVAAMNPCPCGNAGSGTPCKCGPRLTEVYRQRLSGPLLDRIDLHVGVQRVDAGSLLTVQPANASDEVRRRVAAARERAIERGRGMGGATRNAELGPAFLLRACALDRTANRALAASANRYRISARSVHRILRVARTIADLAGTERVLELHVLEAAGYRVGDLAPAEEEAS